MHLFEQLLQFFGLYIIKKSQDEMDRSFLDEQNLQAPDFCDVCGYPGSRCICGKFKDDAVFRGR
jgi:hypothetical protein